MNDVFAHPHFQSQLRFEPISRLGTAKSSGSVVGIAFIVNSTFYQHHLKCFFHRLELHSTLQLPYSSPVLALLQLLSDLVYYLLILIFDSFSSVFA